MKNFKVLAFTSAQKLRAEIEKQFSVLASVFCATEWLRMILENIQSKTFTNYVDCSFFFICLVVYLLFGFVGKFPVYLRQMVALPTKPPILYIVLLIKKSVKVKGFKVMHIVEMVFSLANIFHPFT